MGFQLSRRAHARTLTVAQHACEDTLSPHHPLCYFLAQARGMRGLCPVGRVPSLRARCAQPVGSASYIQRPFVKTSCLQSRPQQSKQGLKIDSKTFNTDNTMQLEKEPFAGVHFNIVHPTLCHPRWWGHKDGHWQRGFQTNKWARENCLMWNYWSLFFI